MCNISKFTQNSLVLISFHFSVIAGQYATWNCKPLLVMFM